MGESRGGGKRAGGREERSRWAPATCRGVHRDWGGKNGRDNYPWCPPLVISHGSEASLLRLLRCITLSLSISVVGFAPRLDGGTYKFISNIWTSRKENRRGTIRGSIQKFPELLKKQHLFVLIFIFFVEFFLFISFFISCFFVIFWGGGDYS